MATKLWLETTLKNENIRFFEYQSFKEITPIPQRQNARNKLYWSVWKNNQQISFKSFLNYYFVIQYANGGSLRQYLQRNHQQLTWNNKIRIVGEMVAGLYAIHQEGLSHKNLVNYHSCSSQCYICKI